MNPQTVDFSSLPIRTAIERLVHSMVPFDAQETEHLEYTRKWLASSAEIFRIQKPATPDPHLVVYFVLVDPTSNQILLVDHKKAGLWLPPGGHVEPNEHPQDTVKREIVEELGIPATFLSPHPFLITVTKTVGLTAGHTDVSLWYVLKRCSSDPLTFNPEEFHRIHWFSPPEIPYPLSDPHMIRCIKKLVALNFLRGLR